MTPLDPSQIDELRGLMGDEFNALIAAFRGDSTEQIDAIVRAANQNDSDQLRFLAHGLKGASGNLGATGLAAICERIEASARQHDCAMARSLLGDLHVEYEAVGLALDGLGCH